VSKVRANILRKLKVSLLGLTFLLIGLALPLVLFEGIARIAGLEKLTSQERAAILNEHQLNPDDAERWCRPRDVGAEPARKKIFALGGSSVFSCCGRLDNSLAFPARLNERLAGQFDVKNYALSGRDSFYHEDCVRFLTQAGERPEYWIYYAGHNDFINGRIGSPALTQVFQKYPPVFRITNWLLHHSRLAGLLRRFSRPGIKLLNQATFEKNKNIILEQYKLNVARTHARMVEFGAKMILVTVVSNVETAPISPHSPSPDRELDPTWLHAEGMRLKGAKEFEKSLKTLKRARDQDTSAWRAPTEVNAFLREFAASHPGTVILLDLELELDKFFPIEGISCNFFGYGKTCDYLHPNQRLHNLIAEKLQEILGRAK